MIQLMLNVGHLDPRNSFRMESVLLMDGIYGPKTLAAILSCEQHRMNGGGQWPLIATDDLVTADRTSFMNNGRFGFSTLWCLQNEFSSGPTRVNFADVAAGYFYEPLPRKVILPLRKAGVFQKVRACRTEPALAGEKTPSFAGAEIGCRKSGVRETEGIEKAPVTHGGGGAMFTLEQPSMSINSTDISWSVIRMWNTWKDLDANVSRDHIVNWTATVARGAPGGKLHNVVINCHGLPGWVGIGQGFNRNHLGLFTAWAGLVEKIWFVACLVARIPTTAMQRDLDTNYSGLGASDGNIFCSQLAKNANCYVVAPTEEQRNRGGYSTGRMPTYEGLLLSYGPGGGVTWSHRYASDWAANRE
jgi:hypothetical protein